MSLYSRRWFCALSGSVRGRVSEFRDAHKARYDCLSLCADLNKKNCVRCNRQARRAQSRRACSFNVWPPSGWIIRDVLAGTKSPRQRMASTRLQRWQNSDLTSSSWKSSCRAWMAMISQPSSCSPSTIKRRALGIDVRPDVLSIADEVIE